MQTCIMGFRQVTALTLMQIHIQQGLNSRERARRGLSWWYGPHSMRQEAVPQQYLRVGNAISSIVWRLINGTVLMAPKQWTIRQTKRSCGQSRRQISGSTCLRIWAAALPWQSDKRIPQMTMTAKANGRLIRYCTHMRGWRRFGVPLLSGHWRSTDPLLYAPASFPL